MFIGHFALGLAASRIEKRLPLGAALVASQIPDALWPYFLLTGIETVTIVPGDTAMTPLRFDSYPWSHSLLMVAVAGAIFGAIYRLVGRSSRAAGFVAALAVSHWVLDFVTHRPDLPLVPWGGPKVGLGMWNSVALTVIVEGLMFAGAVAFYARGRAMSRGFWILIAVLGATYVANVVGPPPPGVTPVAMSMVLLVPIVWWWGNRVGVSETASS
jgi:membrane-bound metal-dependent hydrolase YbcI (DUF457 family)